MPDTRPGRDVFPASSSASSLADRQDMYSSFDNGNLAS